MIDLARVREITGRSFAERDLVVLPRDGFTLVVLADDLMAYVPTDDVARARLAAQRRMLPRVAARVSFAVPRPVGPIDCDVDLRVPAPGQSGSAHHERLMSDPNLAARAAEWMGRSLAELHSALTRTELDALAVARPIWPLPHATLVALVDEHLDGSPAARATLERWRTRPAPPDVLVHGDFASHNFAFDPKTGLPTGLFDFHDGGRGPRVLDFALLPSYGEEVLARAVAAYGAHGEPAPPMDEMRLAHAVSAIAYLSTRKSSAIEWVKSAVSAAGFSIL
jgi:aminoglycoside phosphotransferase (APT) family kinase protein